MTDILFTNPEDQAGSRVIRRRVEAGRGRALYEGVYTYDMRTDPAVLVKRNILQIASHLVPGSVIAGRSALTHGLVPDCEDGPDTLFLTGVRKRVIEMPGVRISILPGPGMLPGDTAFQGLVRPSQGRVAIENLLPSRARLGPSRTGGVEAVERWLVNRHASGGPDSLQRILDEARTVSTEIKGGEDAFSVLERMVLAFDRGDPNVLKTFEARSLAAGFPVDTACLTRLRALADHLLKIDPSGVASPVVYGAPADTNSAFMEAYFSNYIEGTDFLVGDAVDICMKGRIPHDRPADGHDVLSTYRQVTDIDELRSRPSDANAFLADLMTRHAELMGARPDKEPGEFKTRVNHAGTTVFVSPDKVRGTLLAGYEILSGIHSPMARALFVHFLVADVHPFADGNGRMARIMMTKELVAGGLGRIVVPTVFRDDYIAGMRSLSRHGDPAPIVRALSRLQDATSRISNPDLQGTIEDWARTYAFCEGGRDARMEDHDPDRIVEWKDGVPAPADYWAARNERSVVAPGF